MAGDKKIAQSEPLAAGLKSDTRTQLADQSVASRSDRMPAASLPYPEDTVASIKTDKKSVVDQGVKYSHTGCYDYQYPGYSGTFGQADDHGYLNAGAGSYTGVQSENGSPLYYMPGYNPYAAGGFVGVDGQQSYFPSSGYPQYSWDSTYVGDITHGSKKSAEGSNMSVKSNSYNSQKMNAFSGRTSNSSADMRLRQPCASSNISKSIFQAQQIKSLSKLGSSFQAGGFARSFQPSGNYSSFTNTNQNLWARNYSLNYTSSARLWNENDRFKIREKAYTNGGSEVSSELTRGPRAHTSRATSANEDEKPALLVRKDQYNLEDFQIKYDQAKFFVIKSYSEDDVHKCIKYDVWSSTPNGNKKLDTAFLDAEVKASEMGKKCPVFLFFSVNGSGQFVGVAEMIGHVDFDKNMDFWQLDKWSGFFPVKWHIIKDIPNSQLRHIILENNDNRPVTYTRDTQEVGLEQGLEMLSIFKSYSAKTYLFDDFSFYESREQQLKAKRTSKAAGVQPEIYPKNDFPKNVNGGDGSLTTNGSADIASIVDRTSNLTLDTNTPRTNAVVGPGEKLVP